jgi:multiple sugar transport system permease protein
MMQTYVTAFSDFNFGEGYALSLIVVVMTAFVAMLLLLLIYRRVTY